MAKGYKDGGTSMHRQRKNKRKDGRTVAAKQKDKHGS